MSLPVTVSKDQEALLKSADPKLAANKKLVYDFYRIVLRARRLELAEQYMKEDYMQHNPNAATGIKGFKDFFSNSRDRPRRSSIHCRIWSRSRPKATS